MIFYVKEHLQQDANRGHESLHQNKLASLVDAIVISETITHNTDSRWQNLNQKSESWPIQKQYVIF